MAHDRVKVLVGDNDDQWEVRCSREVHRETGISPFLVPSLSIEVDPITGQISLFGGYRAGSSEEVGERTLFESCKEDIVVGLADRGIVAQLAVDGGNAFGA